MSSAPRVGRAREEPFTTLGSCSSSWLARRWRRLGFTDPRQPGPAEIEAGPLRARSWQAKPNYARATAKGNRHCCAIVVRFHNIIAVDGISAGEALLDAQGVKECGPARSNLTRSLRTRSSSD